MRKYVRKENRAEKLKDADYTRDSVIETYKKLMESDRFKEYKVAADEFERCRVQTMIFFDEPDPTKFTFKMRELQIELRTLIAMRNDLETKGRANNVKKDKVD